MGDYASKGLAGTALGFGIGGTALGVLNNSCCGNGGLLGNLLGGGNCCYQQQMMQRLSDLQAENSLLKAENYSDKNAKEVYMQSISDNKELRNEFYAYIKPLADEAAANKVALATLTAKQECCCEKQALQAEITAGKINEATQALNGKIDVITATNLGTFNTLNQTISCINNSLEALTARFNALTQENIALCKVCPQPMQRFNYWTTPTGQAPDCNCASANAA